MDPRREPGTFEIGRDGPGTLVVGVDDSDTSAHALAYALGMARRERSDLVVVTVLPVVSVGAGMAGAVGVPTAPGEKSLLPDNFVRGLDELLHGRWRHDDRRGEAAAELAAAAEEVRADAIVVGRSRAPARHVLGSVAARLVRHATTPVIVVP